MLDQVPDWNRKKTKMFDLENASSLSMQMGIDGNAFETWLKAIGLLFDPFFALEASSDLHLSSYFIGHEAFAVAWGNWNSVIFAPAGGGKTALRGHVIQSFWVGQETNRPFPINYLPPYIKWGHIRPSKEDHILAISQSGAEYLLFALAHRPHWYLRLSEAAKQSVGEALAWNLPGPLLSYLRPCQKSGSLDPMRGKFPPMLLPPDPPETDILIEFLDSLVEHQPSSSKPDPEVSLDLLLDVLLNTFHFPSVYILLDGLDATREIVDDPALVVDFFVSLAPCLRAWNARRVYLKSFIPIETKTPLETHSPDFIRQSQVTIIEWTPTLLSELVHRRIYVASRGTYGGLGPFSSPEIRDPEIVLARAVIPLPREMLVLTRSVFTQVIERARQDGNPKITDGDLDLAIKWYKRNPICNTDFFDENH